MDATSLLPSDDERLVTLVLCDATGHVLGELAPFSCPPRHWPEVSELVAQTRSRFGLEVRVLRLLTTERSHDGGAVSYLAQLVSGHANGLAAVSPQRRAAVDSDPAHRAWWAVPGGLDDLAAWVDPALADRGAVRSGPLVQRKTWNLSCVLIAPTTMGNMWVKAVAPFLADEGGVIAQVALVDETLPPLVLAHDAERRAVLMAEVPGEDQWGLADEEVIWELLERWVRVQAALAGAGGQCLAAGAFDGRDGTIVAGVRRAVEAPETFAILSARELQSVHALLEDLPRRIAELDTCGLPETLVHGDLHPGNWRRSGSRLTLLDWGDCSVGNPALDLRAFLERLDAPSLKTRAVARWAELWRDHFPGCDPERAAELVRPISELVAAATYQRFLDHIEQTERVYHQHDPVDRLRAALRAAASN